jgi:hypothetical protein
MGMAANPSGAHQAGRVFTGRIDEGRRVSVLHRHTLARQRAMIARSGYRTPDEFINHPDW